MDRSGLLHNMFLPPQQVRIPAGFLYETVWTDCLGSTAGGTACFGLYTNECLGVG